MFFSALGALTLFLCASLSAAGANAVETGGSVTIDAEERWHTVFDGQELVRHFRLHAPKPREGLAVWTLGYESRGLARGEMPFLAGPDNSQALAIRVSIPPIRDGIRMPLRLTVTLFDAVTRDMLAAREEKLWVFSKDPFAPFREKLAHLPILLIDPADATATVLTSLGIPFSRIRNIVALEDQVRGLLIVGNGVDFSVQRGLWESLVAYAARSHPVLVLAPAGGRVSLADPRLQAGAWQLRRDEVISALDGMLDATAWPPDGRISAAVMRLVPSREGVDGEFLSGIDGWPWFEADLTGGGKLVVCGFDIVGKIEEGPSPRYLLAAVLSHLLGNGKSNEGDSHEKNR